jgi:hypothetical protein
MKIENIWQFMSDSPFLTFFLVLLIGQTLIYVAKYAAVAVRGWPKKDDDDGEDDDE